MRSAVNWIGNLCILACAMVLLACSSSKPWFISPPPGLGDEVQVPPELQDEFDRFVAEDLGSPKFFEFDQMSLEERRAYAYFSSDSYPLSSINELQFATTLDKEVQARAVLSEVAERLRASSIEGDYESAYYIPPQSLGDEGSIEPFWHFSLILNYSTRAEMAWLGDWVIQSYPDDFVVTYPGPDLTTP